MFRNSLRLLLDCRNCLGKVKTIAGIPGSDWDTPIINIYYSDGKEKKVECFKEVTSDEFADFCRKL